jgi:rod shape-determining protein MreC
VSAPRDWLLLVALCAAGAALGRYQTVERNQGRQDAVTYAAQSAYGPLTMSLTAAANALENTLGGLVGGGERARRERRWREMESAAALYSETASRLHGEIERLREMLELDPMPGQQRIPASVVGYFPLEGRATLDRGLAHGIRKGAPVVAAQGLYGIVQTVENGRCQVLLISSARLRIVGTVQRDPPPAGFIRGQSAGVMVFEVLDAKALPQTGDMVVTAGFSERIPAGIPIGRIVQIEEDLAFGARRCQVFPNVQVTAVREVFVLR